MCTALSIRSHEGNCFFGRNMDLAYSFHQSPLFIPRNATYRDRVTDTVKPVGRAILGMGTIIDDHPAMAEGMNESGLACVGLNFSRYAHYESEPIRNKINIAPYDFILWVLTNHNTVDEVEKSIGGIELVDVPINAETPIPTLHWMITDITGRSLTVEKTKEKFAVHRNPVGVMTNDPTFDWHLTNLNEYMKLTPEHPKPVAWSEQQLSGLGIGAGTLGMPGDFSSVSRFVRIAYIRAHMPDIVSDAEAVAQFFHMLDYVAMVKGGVLTEEGTEDATIYSSCMDLKQGIYYYKTYENNRICAIKMRGEDVDGRRIKVYPYPTAQDVDYQN